MAGGMSGGRHVWQGAFMAGGMCGEGGVYGGGMHGRGMHGWEHVWLEAYIAEEGVHGRGCAWQGGMCCRGACMAGCVWQGACVAGGECMAGGHVWWGHVWQLRHAW